tara:strand:- start:76 stop:1083 length:1008 start_codon:yes stop_codon:yes gene_type:complete
MSRKKLFTIVHPYSNPNKDFSITINHPVWITDDRLVPKRESKRVLLEMIDTHSKLILAYSGGTDSSFALCCIRDLINEKKIKPDTIEIVQGVFTADGIPLTMDRNRATRFARKLGFEPRIYEFDVNERWLEAQNFYYDFCLSGYAAITDIFQTLWASDQDGHVIRTSGTSNAIWFGLNYNKDGFRMPTINVLWDLPNNQVNLSTWDNKIFSSFITPYRLFAPSIDQSPFEEAEKYESTSPTNSKFNRDGMALLEKYLDKWMTYLQCYPEMAEILGKFLTIDWSAWNHHSKKRAGFKRMKDFWDFQKKSEYRFAEVKFSDGRPLTKKDLMNYDQYS